MSLTAFTVPLLATIVEAGSEWTLISSGNVTGYVSNQYCVTGTDAMNYAKENCPTVATVNEDCLRLRADMTTEAEVVKVLAQGCSSGRRMDSNLI